MQVSSSSVARPWELEQKLRGKLRGRPRGRPRGPQGYGNWRKQCDKEGPCFCPQNVRKSGRAKMGLPSNCSVAVQCDVTLHLAMVPVAV